MKLFYVNRYYRPDSSGLESEVHIFNNYYDAYQLFLSLLKQELGEIFYKLGPNGKRETDEIQSEEIYQRLITSGGDDVEQDGRIFNLDNDTFYIEDDANGEYACRINLLPYELE